MRGSRLRDGLEEVQGGRMEPKSAKTGYRTRLGIERQRGRWEVRVGDKRTGRQEDKRTGRQEDRKTGR